MGDYDKHIKCTNCFSFLGFTDKREYRCNLYPTYNGDRAKDCEYWDYKNKFCYVMPTKSRAYAMRKVESEEL